VLEHRIDGLCLVYLQATPPLLPGPSQSF